MKHAGWAACLLAAGGWQGAQGAMAEAAALDAEVARAMAATRAQGLAIAVFDAGRVVSVRSHGRRNGAGDPLQDDTVMRCVADQGRVRAHGDATGRRRPLRMWN